MTVSLEAEATLMEMRGLWDPMEAGYDISTENLLQLMLECMVALEETDYPSGPLYIAAKKLVDLS